MPENIFFLCDTRLSLSDETAFKKLWGEKFFFNSNSNDKRGIAILVKDDTPINDIKCEKIIKGNFSKLTFKVKNEHVLVKCIYAPNKDMNNDDPENESTTFFKKFLMTQMRDFEKAFDSVSFEFILTTLIFLILGKTSKLGLLFS